MKVKLSELENLRGCDPGEAYSLAKKYNLRVLAVGDDILPTKLFFDTVYIRVDDDEFIEKAWVNETHIEYDTL